VKRYVTTSLPTQEFNTLGEAQAYLHPGVWYGPEQWRDTQWLCWKSAPIAASGYSLDLDALRVTVVEIGVTDGVTGTEVFHRYLQKQHDIAEAAKQARKSAWRASLADLQPKTIEGVACLNGKWDIPQIEIGDTAVNDWIEIWLRHPINYMGSLDRLKVGRVRLTIEWLGVDDDD
jgi:hypothetical protein